jgi:hypothetical protein
MDFLSVGFDDYFDRLLRLGNKFKTKASLLERKPMGDHLTEWQTMGPY